ncbi:MAG: ATP-binding protein [Chloroflexota bacterium]|nr:ATP-binding protein [Chloroflexota bacterium]
MQEYEETDIKHNYQEINNQPISVLLVEDDPGDARLVRRVLKKQLEPSFSVEVSERLSAALVRIREVEFDIMLLDLSLPDSQGVQTVAKVISEAPHTPVVVLTGLDSQEVGLEALQRGAEDYLTKGQDIPNLLVRTIRYAIERKKTKRALQESEAKYSTLVELSNDGIMMIRDGEAIFANQRVCEMCGHTQSSINHSQLQRFFPPEQRGFIEKRYRNNTENKAISLVYELHLPKKSGKAMWAEINANRVEYDEKPTDLLFIRDITERKLSEQKISQKNEELRLAEEELRGLNLNLEEKVKERTIEVEELLNHKDQFIRQLGHDLRSPLTPLVALLPIVENHESDPKLKEMVTEIIHNVNYMKDLVEKTLTLARLSTSVTELDIHDVALRLEVDQLIIDRVSILKKNRFQIINNIEEFIIVRADKPRLRELFDNLINNAIKFSHSGGILTIDATSDGNYATISFRDTGIGMTTEQIDHAFQEFYKADESRHELDSPGLGLSICKRIVDKHGGQIWAESKGIDMGTTIFVTLQLSGKSADGSAIYPTVRTEYQTKV